MRSYSDKCPRLWRAAGGEGHTRPHGGDVFRNPRQPLTKNCCPAGIHETVSSSTAWRSVTNSRPILSQDHGRRSWVPSRLSLLTVIGECPAGKVGIAQVHQGDGHPPSPPPSLASLGERATVAPRGWLHVIPPRSVRWNEEMDERSARRNHETGCHNGPLRPFR
jgi:hypothetical protein